MAFNFNWSPLIADTSRARDMLTVALNKSPKPPIIVGDILVTELNLGSVPPELEILEIGDLAEDRFRGIFKMSYSGDAFLTLKTRVQANPLNTYLSTKPSFASPKPLAASSGLTIPLQISLSDIRLSGFVILVFSKQKGITLVFRNDPLDSIKVSSTFDSISFVRDYLQKEIEGQLRVLFMEDLPAIIHRLSLRVFSPEHGSATASETAAHNSSSNSGDTSNIRQRRPSVSAGDSSSPRQEPYDSFMRDPGGLADDMTTSFTLDPETSASFSQKNILRLATLSDSYRTLSLFTPPIKDAVFRAWAGASERGELGDTVQTPLTLASLSKAQAPASVGTSTKASSTHSRSQTHSISEASGPAPTVTSTTHTFTTISSRNSATSFASLHNGASIAGASRSRTSRKRKHRVLNLRSKPDEKKENSVPKSAETDIVSRPSTPTSSAGHSSSRSGPSLASAPAYLEVENERGEVITPEQSPEKKQPQTQIKIQRARNNAAPELHSPQPVRARPSSSEKHALPERALFENPSPAAAYARDMQRQQAVQAKDRSIHDHHQSHHQNGQADHPDPESNSALAPEPEPEPTIRRLRPAFNAPTELRSSTPLGYRSSATHPSTQPDAQTNSLHSSTIHKSTSNASSTSSGLTGLPAFTFPSSSTLSHLNQSSGYHGNNGNVLSGAGSGTATPSSFGGTGGILEQAWMMKMANEIARRVREEHDREVEDRKMAIATSDRQRAVNGEGSLRSRGKGRGVFWTGEGDVQGGAQEGKVEGEVGIAETDGEAPPAYSER